MQQGRFTEVEILDFLKQNAGGVPLAELCRRYRFSDTSFYKWKRKYAAKFSKTRRKAKR